MVLGRVVGLAGKIRRNKGKQTMTDYLAAIALSLPSSTSTDTNHCSTCMSMYWPSTHRPATSAMGISLVDDSNFPHEA